MYKRKENIFLSQCYAVSQETINQYAQVSGGMGLIHTDPEYAKTTYFKRTLVHGLYILAIIEKDFNSRIDNSLGCSEIKVTYLKPIAAEQPFYIKYIENGPGIWGVTVLSNNEKMIVGSISM